jgi:transposase
MDNNITRPSEVTIGLDIGDKRSHAVLLNAKGKWAGEQKIGTTRSAVAAAFPGLEGATVVIEVGTHSAWISRTLRDRGFEVIVANPRRVRLIAAAHKKNDRVDAEMLARLGRADPLLLAPVTHRSEQAQKDIALIRSRDGLVRARASLIVQARGLAKALGIHLPGCSTPAFPKRMRSSEEAQQMPGLHELLDVIDALTRNIRSLERRIEEVANARYPEHRCLTQVTGVGTLTALCFILVIHDPTRFSKSRDVAAFLGLVPKQRDSGERHPQLGITKRGDPYLRRLLVHSAHYILGPFGPECDLRTFGLKLAERGDLASRNRATVAVARKLAVLLHRLLITGEVYAPVGYDPKGGHLMLNDDTVVALQAV